MSNRVTLNDLVRMTDAEIGAIPPDQLRELQNDLADLKAEYESRSHHLLRAFTSRYGDTFEGQREKDTGVVHIEDGDYQVSQDIRKTTTYDQKKIGRVLDLLKSSGEDITEYVEVSYKVPERKWTVWPAQIKRVFEPARIVKASTPKYTVEIAR